MQSIELKGNLRKNLGKKDAKMLRRKNEVPCVVYGGKENLHFSSQAGDFKNLIYTHRVYAVDLQLDGKLHKAILKDIQFHPVSEDIMHVDFMEINEDRPITLELPVEITGNSIGVRAGGKLRQRKRYLKVKGLLKDLPDMLKIDISDLNIGQSVLAGEIKYPNIEIVEPHHTLVVGIVSSRVAKGMEEAGAAAAGEAAPTEAAPGEAK